MPISLFSRLKGKAAATTDVVATPDLSRITRPAGDSDHPPRRQRPVAPASGVDMGVWMRADLDRLSTTWDAARSAPGHADAAKAFSRAVHDLLGASGAYGGGALTRLSGSLHKLIQRPQAIATEAALINLHVQACRACALGNADGQDEISNAVCDALESQVDKAVSA